MPCTHKTVAVYELDREYGGPEEGGWWYDSGCLVKRITVPARQVANALRQAEAWVDSQRRPRYALGSTRYCGGVYRIDIHDGRRAPITFPTRRPHYE